MTAPILPAVRRRGPARVGLGVLALSLLGGAAGCGIGGDDSKTLTAEFTRAVGLYEASDVRILGVRIGEVTSIVPEGTKVRVTMKYDRKYTIPADAKALVIAPSIVSDRYVQLTPVYSAGAQLKDGAVLGTDATDVPLELDDIFASINKLNLALGPNGANKGGALNDLLGVGADNLKGNGALINSTLKDFSTLVTTLNGQRDDLFGTITNLQDFTTTLANSDTTVRNFNRDLAAVSEQLADERGDLATAIKQLSVALGEVASFVRENKKDLTANVSDLASVTKVLVKQKSALEEFLDDAPTALSNLQLAYNPVSGTLDTRDNGAGQTEANPLGPLCNLLITVGQGAELCQQVAGALPAPTGLPSLPPFPPGSAAAPQAARTAPVERDMTLGGILDGGR